MREVRCQGTPYEIGHQHGLEARTQVHGSIAFYKDMFMRNAKLTWPQVRLEAVKFLPTLEQPPWLPLVEEMRGLADGAGLDLEDILSLNVRTEIAYGMFSDGCTAFSWKAGDKSFIAQNWDWENEQSPNIISLHITQSSPSSPSSNDPLPTIHMMTEAGIIGKIGLNSSSVGVTLNAIRARGVDFAKLPCHLALRTVLNSTSRAAAVEKLTSMGVASACHITVADAATGGVGLECSAADVVQIPMSDRGVCTHSNHFVNAHADGVKDVNNLSDSPQRLARIRTLLAQEEDQALGRTSRPSFEVVERLLQDEEGYPGSICRAATEKSSLETLFSVCMDLGERWARVKMGRPVEVGGETVELRP